jgi:Icc-related predicted phosphoesterase
MEDNTKKVRLAAVGDIHIKENDHGNWKDFFSKVSEIADILLLCGDVTDTGHLHEAEVFLEEIRACKIPIIGVLGNHDYERGQQKQIKKMLEQDGVYMLNGEAVILNGIGFAGIKGYGGGFDRYMLSMFGEPMNKEFVQEAVDEALKLDRALVRLESQNNPRKKVVIMHYSPIKETVIGEPEEIWPFLGCSRLAEPLNRRQVDVAFHGHAHVGKLEGATSGGVKVFNVAKAILQNQGFDPPVFIYEI